MGTTVLLCLLVALASPLLAAQEYPGYSAGIHQEYKGYATPIKDVSLDVEGKSVNNPGMDATSKACRYEDNPGWSDCDPFELVRFRVLRLIHGGSQCEEMKNITKHCTPHNFPYGTHWLIQEHRKCISELNRLKTMISDLYKFIETMHKKGKELFEAYLKLKAKLEDLSQKLDKLKIEGNHQQEILQKIKEEIEEWKSKARELQIQLDELKTKYHDLETEEHEISLKNEQLNVEINVISKENEGIIKRIEILTHENEELKRRIVDSVAIREKVKELKELRSKMTIQLEKVQEKLQDLRDEVAELRIKNLANSIKLNEEDFESKDTHVDLSMEMFITHNKTTIFKPTYKPIYYTTEKYYNNKYIDDDSPKCLISYYGVTNETCWYETDGEKSEDSYVNALGQHLVEAHWKYFTIDVKNQYECDKASQLHYEFLLNRCSPKHYLPVLSVFRPNSKAKELGTHVYPKIESKGGSNACWITFLGAHGHCESHSSKYNLYNTPENLDVTSATSKQKCLARAEFWMKYCNTPVIVTYIPEEVSTNWQYEWIMHDSHGGRMFEDAGYTRNQINPDSLKPQYANPSKYKSQYKSMDPKSPDYHDSPEYRKSLHLQGKQKEELLAHLREKLGISGKVSGRNNDVKEHYGVDTEKSPDAAVPIYKSSIISLPRYSEYSAPTTAVYISETTAYPSETTASATYKYSTISNPTTAPATYPTPKPPKYQEMPKDESAEKY